jgi:hypothetical protein
LGKIRKVRLPIILGFFWKFLTRDPANPIFFKNPGKIFFLSIVHHLPLPIFRYIKAGYLRGDTPGKGARRPRYLFEDLR